jgi:predicted dehydrogenase
MMDVGVQALDLCLWMLDFPEAASVTSHMHFPPGMEVEDNAAILVRLVNGAAVSLTVSWSLVAERDRHYMRMLGTRGSGAISPLAVFKEVETGQMIDVTPDVTLGRENLYTASYRRELSHFVAVALGKAEEPLPREQVQIMKIVQAAYRSSEEKTGDRDRVARFGIGIGIGNGNGNGNGNGCGSGGGPGTWGQGQGQGGGAGIVVSRLPRCRGRTTIVRINGL